MKMNEFTIRSANADDIAEIAKLESLCFSDPWEPVYFENLLRNPSLKIFVACSGETPVGYGIIAIIVDEGEILNVAVSPEYRGLGLGRMLMNEMIGICKTSLVSSLFLEHRESNTPAAKLYESLGFIEFGRRRRYYKNPVEDAILRRLTL